MSSKRRHHVYWKGQIVGFIEDLNMDMFHWYGTWIPLVSPTTDAFLASASVATREDGLIYDDIWIGIGENTPAFRLECLPDRTLEVGFRPNSPASWGTE